MFESKHNRPEVVIKLGGSTITEKSRIRGTAKRKILRRLASEIATANLLSVVVHGGGSYGHPLAERYRIAEGFTSEEQIQGIAETHRSMVSLNNLVVDELSRAGCPSLGVTPWSTFSTSNGRIESANLRPIAAAAELGLTPVLYGDVAFDRNRTFTILSGDQIAAYLAMELKAKRLVFALDVAGIYTDNPRLKGAQLIEKLSLGQLRILATRASSSTRGRDVTGGMRRKLMESISAVEAGVDVCFASASESGNIRSAIKGKSFKGTFVEGSSRA